METTISTSLPTDDVAELDQICRQERLGRSDALTEALRWFIATDGHLPPRELDDEGYF